MHRCIHISANMQLHMNMYTWIWIDRYISIFLFVLCLSPMDHAPHERSMWVHILRHAPHERSMSHAPHERSMWWSMCFVHILRSWGALTYGSCASRTEYGRRTKTHVQRTTTHTTTHTFNMHHMSLWIIHLTNAYVHICVYAYIYIYINK